jgi:hypothetical protein
MPVIGEELRALLGMIPVRDRAGIARGNLAQETLANEANAEGRALLQPASMNPGAMPPPGPPPLAIPPGMGTGRPGPADPDTTGSVEPQPTRTTTVTAPPAGAAAQFEGEMARRAKMAGVNDIVSSLGMIINGAANRGPSQGSTRDTLLAGMGSGGMSVPEVIAVDKHRQELLKDAENKANRETAIQSLMRLNGYDRAYASTIVDSGKAGDVVDPKNVAAREAASRDARTRMDLSKPEVVNEIAKRTGQPTAVVEADIRNGKIGQKELADILNTQATTAHTTAATGKLDIENMTALQKKTFVADVTSSPEAYARLWGVTPDEVRTAAHGGPEGLQKLIEGIAPKKTDKQQDLAVENRMRKEKNLPELTPSEYSRQSQQPHLKDAANEAETVEYKKRLEEIRGHRDKALEAKHFIEVDNEAIGRKFNENPNLLLGPFSEKVLDQRRFLSDVLKLPSKAVQDADSFKAALKEYGLAVNKAFKGNFSDKDQETVNAIVGGNYTSATLRDILELREKHKLLEWQSARNELKAGHADPKVGQTAKDFIPDVAMPAMGAVMRKRFDAEGGDATAMAYLAKNRDNPKALAGFDREWGAGRAEYYLGQLAKQ